MIKISSTTIKNCKFTINSINEIEYYFPEFKYIFNIRNKCLYYYDNIFKRKELVEENILYMEELENILKILTEEVLYEN